MKERVGTRGRKPHRKPYKIGQRSTLTNDPPFTPEGLRVILGTVLPGYTPPGYVETTKLCEILNYWHTWFYRAQEERKFNALATEARNALETLYKIMPRILEDLHKRDKIDPGRNQFLSWQLKHAKALAPCLNPTALGFLQPYDLPDQALDWRWVANVLPIDIERALRPANPRYPAGHSKGGPLTKILAAVIPSITGERVTAIAIGNQIGYIVKSNLSEGHGAAP